MFLIIEIGTIYPERFWERDLAANHYFHRVRHSKNGDRSTAPPNQENLLKLITDCVVKPFERVMRTTAIVVPMNGTHSNDDEERQPNPCHPACAEYASSDYCRESWQLHLTEVKRRPEAHWHTCEFGMFCGLVPVACDGYCLAALKLACPASISEEVFDQNVAFLDVLVENFSITQADFLRKLASDEPAVEDLNISRSCDDRDVVPQVARHAQIEQAVCYIEANFCDPSLTVAGVARHLDLHVNHLCRLFVAQMGRRMSRFIADRRIEMAKSLLATTKHQIKRIAHETGHAHPNWFSHMFTLHTGMTPGEYRKRARTENSG